MSRKRRNLYIGLMSGTSLDGVDAALVELVGSEERPERARLVGFVTHAYEEAFRARLGRATRGEGGAAELCDLGFELGHRFAQAAEALLPEAGVAREDVAAAGSHGQTVWHRAPAEGSGGATLQIGEAAVVAERLGVPVVADFRVRDVASGGHGAPLTPYFDRLLLSSAERSRAVQNIGGIANVTALPREGSADRPLAFDTGPGVALLDGAVRSRTGERHRFDEDGRLAAAGTVIDGALSSWLCDDFFRLPPPRSTGRERFGDRRLEAWLEAHAAESAADLAATLTELTARTIAESYAWIEFPIEEVLLCGGGARNPELRRRLAAHLGPTPVRVLDEIGWNADAREAAAFALLARQHLLGIAVDLSWATGSPGPRILGKMIPA